MKNLILTTILFGSLQAFAQISQNKCGETVPQYCVGQQVLTNKNGTFDKFYRLEITAVSNDLQTYSAKYLDYSGSAVDHVKASDLLITKLGTRGQTTPRLAVGDVLLTSKGSSFDKNYRIKIAGLTSDLKSYYISYIDYNGAFDTNRSVDGLNFITPGTCGKTQPSLCIDDEVLTNLGSFDKKYRGKIIGVSVDYKTYLMSYIDYSGSIESNLKVETVSIIKRANPNTLASMNAYLSADTQDVVNTYQSLASVVTQERSEFLKSSSAYLTQLNSEDVNMMAGFVLAKIVRLSTSDAVKQNFEKTASNFIALMATKNFKSIDDIEANIRTIDFATRVIFAAVKLKSQIANSHSRDAADLALLGQIATQKQLSIKIKSLQEFCNSHKSLIEDLTQDPRHGALGMVTADIMQWVLNN